MAVWADTGRAAGCFCRRPRQLSRIPTRRNPQTLRRSCRPAASGAKYFDHESGAGRGEKTSGSDVFAFGKTGMRNILVLYMPVLHAGYLRLFASLAGRLDALYILGLEFTQELSPFGKEIRAVEPDVMQKVIEALELFPVVRVLTPATLDEVKDAEILTADEEISQAFAKKYLQGVPVTIEKIFLRWYTTHIKANENVAYARVSTDAFDREMADRAAAEAEKSSD